eukprot:scpid29519/ scgid34695/ Uncharacterized protein yrkH
MTESRGERHSPRGQSPQIPTLPSGYRETLTDGDVEVLIYYLGCLAQASYIVRDRKAKTAFVIDPRRDVDAYTEELAAHRTRLKGVFLTHIHADFVSGHAELGRRGDADIYMGPGVKKRAGFEVLEVEDGKHIKLSDRYSLQSMHSPGHTPESTTWVLTERNLGADPDQTSGNVPLFAFTGDTLFIGSCGRPDLVGSLGNTAEDMAKLMYKSLHTKLMQLPDNVKVLPAHGAGSPCGKSLSDALWSTIGEQKQMNPALQIKDANLFVAYLTEGQPHSPQYFHNSVETNLKGAGHLKSDVLGAEWKSAVDALSEISELSEAIILDTRDASQFAKGHLAGALNVPKGGCGGTVVLAHEGNFAIWVGTLISKDCKIFVIAPTGQEYESLERLARIGYTAHAVITGEPQQWQDDGVDLVCQQQLYPRDEESIGSLVAESSVIVDVRTPGEYSSNRMQTAVNWPLAQIAEHVEAADRSKTYYCYCVSGFRSAIGASWLSRAGLSSVNMLGGFATLGVNFTHLTATGKVCPVMRKTADAVAKLYE